MQAPRPPGGPLIFNHSYNAGSVAVLTFDRHDAGAPFCAAPLRFVRMVLAIVGCHLRHFAGRVRTIVRDQGRVAWGERRIGLPG